MEANKEGDSKHCFMVPFTSKLRAMFLVEVAQSRGLEVCMDVGNRYEVCILAEEEDVKSAVEAARDGEALLYARQLEALHKAIGDIGETPSGALIELIVDCRRKAGLSDSGMPIAWSRERLDNRN